MAPIEMLRTGDHPDLSRRDFLAASSFLAVGIGLAGSAALGQDARRPARTHKNRPNRYRQSACPQDVTPRRCLSCSGGRPGGDHPRTENAGNACYKGPTG